MRRLDRSKAKHPVCLSCFKHGQNCWTDLTRQDREEIWAELTLMQGELCAYCESRIYDRSRHIEHFRDKHRHPVLTFAWNNLLGCCMSTECCGHYKDSRAAGYDPNDLIDPSIEDPDDYFTFRTDGTITVNGNRLSPTQQTRAAETLRVLNLDDKRGRLRRCRKTAVEVYLATYPNMLVELEDCDDDERKEYAEYEIRCIEKDPHSTPIRHLLQNCI